MSQNSQKVFNYLQENHPEPEVFGDFDFFNEQIKDPKKAEKVRTYLNNEELFGDSASFYNDINSEDIEPEEVLSVDSNFTVTTVEDSNQILQNELNNPGSSSAVFEQIINPDYEINQKIDSSDHGYFQINDKVWNDTSMSMFGKPVADLSNVENIELASFIEKEDPRSWNNWVAFNKGRHKQFEGLTDEQITNKYNVPTDVIGYINQSFDNPKLAKQVMLAESAGDSLAKNINYTPQKENEQTIPEPIKQQSQQITKELEASVAPKKPPPYMTNVMVQKLGEQKVDVSSPITATSFGPWLQTNSEKLLRYATRLDNPGWNRKEYQNAKEFTELSVNVMSHLAEMPGVIVDIPSAFASSPVETTVGLLKFIPEEFNNLVIASNVLDVLNPFLGLIGKEYSKEELSQMRANAQKHIYDTGGVYTYFAAAGLKHAGKKNSKIIEKNKEFSDIIDLANDKPVSGKVTPEMNKAVEVLKENSDLKQKAEVVKNNELLTDYLEQWEIENKTQKAEVRAEQLELGLDVGTKNVGPLKPAKKPIKVGKKKEIFDPPRNPDGTIKADNFFERVFNETSGLQGKIIKSENGHNVKVLKETTKSFAVEILDGPNKGLKKTIHKRNMGARGETPIITIQKGKNILDNIELKEPVKPTKTTPEQVKQLIEIKKQSKKNKSTEIDLDRDMPSPQVSLSVRKNKIKKEAKKIEEKVAEVSKKIKQDKIKAEKIKSKEIPTEPVEQIKLTKSSDLNIGKNIEPIKGESAKRFKTKEKLDNYIETKLGEYVGQNVIARYGELDKGGFVVKIFKKTKEQPLPVTATKRPGAKITKDIPDEMVAKMRDPKGPAGETGRRIQNNDLLIEKYKEEISELGRNTSSMLAELEILQKQVLETGVESPRIQLIKNSIDATNKLINKSQNQLREITPTKELLKSVSKNILKRTSKGAVGRNVGKSTKEKAKQRIENQKLVNEIMTIWERGETGLKMTKNNLINYLRELGADKVIIKHVNENFKELYDTATIQSAKTVANEIAKETPLSPGEVVPTRTARRGKEEYIDNIRVDIISGTKPNDVKIAMVDLLEVISENIGGEASVKAKGTRGLDVIKRGSNEQKVYAQIINELQTGKLSIESLPEKQSASINLTYHLLEQYAKTKNPAVREILIESLLMSKAYISEPARALRNLKDLKAEGIRDWKQFEQFFNNDATLIDILRDVYNNKEVKRSRLFKVAEWARNAKLATGSSLVRSVAGNAFASVDAYARMPFEFGLDYAIRKTSGALYELSNGYWGNLSPNQITALELGAQVTGYTKGFKKTGNLLYDMFLENDVALRESPFFRREGFTNKDIKGAKGVVVRTPQRLQGMIDIMYRVPMTNAYMHRYSVRQAIKEGKKTQTEILQRANEIMEMQELSPELLEQAIKDGEYVTFQRELGEVGKFVNKLRTGNTRMSALTQIMVPFFNTAGNLFKYTVEHTPLNVFTKNFRQGFVEAFSKEGAGSRKLATESSKMVTGLGTLYLLNEFLVENMKGNISGDWSNISPEERNMRTVMGQQEYSIEFPDGSTVSYRGFEPVSTYITMIEALQRSDKEAYKNQTSIEKTGETVYNVTKEVAKQFLENPFLAGTGDLFKVLNGRRDFLDYGFNQMAGALVPGSYRQWLSVVDPVRRKRLKLVERNENIDIIDVLESQAENVLPWFIEGSNMEALDPFGNEIPKPDPVGGLLAWRQTQRLDDPVYAEIQKIYFDNKKGFKSASAFFTSSDLAKIKLTPGEHQALIKVSGQNLYNFVDNAIKVDEWSNMSDAAKRQIINSVKEKYVTTYREIMFSKDLSVPAQIMKVKELKGDFETPEDKEEYLKQMRSDTGIKISGPLKPQKEYQDLLDSLSTIYNQ